MDPIQLREHLLRNLSLRVGDEMAAYIHRRMTAAFAKAIPVIAADARTGIPVATTLSPSDLSRGDYSPGAASITISSPT